jgi:hypothetical protein
MPNPNADAIADVLRSLGPWWIAHPLDIALVLAARSVLMTTAMPSNRADMIRLRTAPGEGPQVERDLNRRELGAAAGDHLSITALEDAVAHLGAARDTQDADVMAAGLAATGALAIVALTDEQLETIATKRTAGACRTALLRIACGEEAT